MDRVYGDRRTRRWQRKYRMLAGTWEAEVASNMLSIFLQTPAAPSPLLTPWPVPSYPPDPVSGQNRGLFDLWQHTRTLPLSKEALWKAFPYVFLPLGNPEKFYWEASSQENLPYSRAKAALAWVDHTISASTTELCKAMIAEAFQNRHLLGLFWPFQWFSWIICGVHHSLALWQPLSRAFVSLHHEGPIRGSAGGRRLHLRKGSPLATVRKAVKSSSNQSSSEMLTCLRCSQRGLCISCWYPSSLLLPAEDTVRSYRREWPQHCGEDTSFNSD